MNYGLYQTLNQSLPEKKLSDNKKRRLIKRIGKTTPEQKEAVLLLICEHASLNDGYVYQQNNACLPYGLIENESGLEFDLESLPVPLHHILKRFADMIRENNKKSKRVTN